MRIPVQLYPGYPIASIVSIIGSCMIAGSIAFFLEREWITGIIVCVLGMGLMGFAQSIANWERTKKIIKDKDFAVSYILKNPDEFDYVLRLNPEAAAYVLAYLRGDADKQENG